MIQTQFLGVVNDTKGAKVHAVHIGYKGYEHRTICLWHIVFDLVKLDPSESDRLCKRCFAKLPSPWRPA